MESKKRREREYKRLKNEKKRGRSVRQKFVVLGVLWCEVYWKEHVDDGKNNEGLTRRRVEMRDVVK